MTIIHTIPVGGTEPIHRADISCWCHPLLDEPHLMVHHAKDCREARERNQCSRKDEPWVLVEQALP